MNIQEKLKSKFEDIVGEIKVKKFNNTVIIDGNVFVSNVGNFNKELSKIITNKYPGTLISNNLKVNEFVVVDKKVNTNRKYNSELDEINILYYGYLDIDHITPNSEYKVIHEDNRQRLDNIIKVLNFIEPIVLNSDLKVINGNFRLQLAKENGVREVLVVVIDDNDERADFLRLALNRTAEFQRWAYREVDDYVDNTPQAQPLLEPIGFFGRHVLPTSFFSDTVINYVIDPFNEKQKQYSQEEGLAEWAKYRREQMSKLSEAKRAKKPQKTNAVSLFDLTPKEDDFLETYNIDEEMDEFVDKYKEIAGEITDHLDGLKRKEIEEKGGEWQRTHRTSAEVAEIRRLEAIENIQDTELLTEKEKSEVLANLDNYANHVNNIENLVKLLRGEE